MLCAAAVALLAPSAAAPTSCAREKMLIRKLLSEVHHAKREWHTEDARMSRLEEEGRKLGVQGNANGNPSMTKDLARLLAPRGPQGSSSLLATLHAKGTVEEKAALDALLKMRHTPQQPQSSEATVAELRQKDLAAKSDGATKKVKKIADLNLAAKLDADTTVARITQALGEGSTTPLSPRILKTIAELVGQEVSRACSKNSSQSAAPAPSSSDNPEVDTDASQAFQKKRNKVQQRLAATDDGALAR